MRKILVNDVLREFTEPKEFFVRRYDENMKEGNTECSGLRQTGRTTRMVVETIQKVAEDPESKFIILAHNFGMCSRIIGLINHYKYQLDVQLPPLSITVVPLEDYDPALASGTTVLRDNGITDVAGSEEKR